MLVKCTKSKISEFDEGNWKIYRIIYVKKGDSRLNIREICNSHGNVKNDRHTIT